MELHFLSTEFWVVNLEQFFSAKLAFSEHGISIFEHRIYPFSAQNLHLPSVEFPFWKPGILEGLPCFSTDKPSKAYMCTSVHDVMPKLYYTYIKSYRHHKNKFRETWNMKAIKRPIIKGSMVKQPPLLILLHIIPVHNKPREISKYLLEYK